ncbi:MAG: FAD-binding oxidoreductase [Planctomycetes bacterium]|nr:FAD-binding oxidoreductase [Planctomycetota bacterium]
MIELADRVRGLLGPRAVGELEWRGRKDPLALALPASVDEMQVLLRWARAEHVSVVPVGAGSKLGWSRPPGPRGGDVLALSTRRLQRIVEYEPGEGVITALAGTRMATLRDAAREHGHWLTPDVPAAENATLGGVIAAGQSGRDRLRHGPVRHHVLGVRALMADATLAKSGGRLVKNVTGFDLPRLFTGSHGALCVIVEATLRLAVAPRVEAVVTASARDGAELAARARAVVRSRARPISLHAARLDPPTEAAQFALFAHLGGHDEVVRDEIALLRELWEPAAVFEGAEAVELARGQREIDFLVEPRPWLHATTSPESLPAVLGALDRATAFLPTRTLVEPALASVDVQLRMPDGEKLDAARWIELVPALRRELAALGGSLTVRNPTRKLADSGVPWPPIEHGGALMRALRDRLDPDSVFARGRFEEDL